MGRNIDDLSLDGPEQSDEHLLTRGKAVFRALGTNMRSLTLKHLGIFILAHQFKVAAAQALNDSSFYLTGHVGPGCLSIAGMLFEATEFRWASLLALGGKGDAYTLVGLERPERLSYIGLKSSTECPVLNAIGAAILREQDSLWKNERKNFVTTNSNSATTAEPTQEYAVANQNMQAQYGLNNATAEPKERDMEEEAGTKIGTPVGRDAGRRVKVIMLKVQEKPNTEQIRVSMMIEDQPQFWHGAMLAVLMLLVFIAFRQWIAVLGITVVMTLFCCKSVGLVSGWLPPVLTIVVIIICFYNGEKFVAGLLLWGTSAMMLAVLGMRIYVFKYANPKPAEGAPKGDCVVIDEDNPDVFHIIEADEESVQTLFQRKIACEARVGKRVLFVAGTMLYVYVIASALLMSVSSLTGKIYFTVANMIGLLANVYNASRNGKLGLARKACKQFQIEFVGEVEFKNRTAAVVYVAKYATDCNVLKRNKLLPSDGPVWEIFWAELDEHLKVVQSLDEMQEKLLQKLRADMKAGLEVSLPAYRHSSPSHATQDACKDSEEEDTEQV